MEREVALTTVDNPYDPIEDYDNWRAFDYQHGYCCDEFVARCLRTSSDFLSPASSPHKSTKFTGSPPQYANQLVPSRMGSTVVKRAEDGE